MPAEASTSRDTASEARVVSVFGRVQGVGFRPFVYRLAVGLGLAGWVRNVPDGVEIHVEGARGRIDQFVTALGADAPPAARIARIEAAHGAIEPSFRFSILSSLSEESPTVHVSPDLPLCESCLAELRTPEDRRFGYAYITCTDCGPRYSIIRKLPYDRANTTMLPWSMCTDCAEEYEDPRNRRFHAQPLACPKCGPDYRLDNERGSAAIAAAARRLRSGEILAVKGLGGYHLACDATNPAAVAALRERKFRKEKPFALMVSALEVARAIAELSAEEERLLTSPARPIVLLKARLPFEGIAPGCSELGIMLPYAPIHYLLFDSGAPEILVMTSANRSSEPIATGDDEAVERLGGIADAFLTGERPIARRVDDSIARLGPSGPVVLRRARGYAPAVEGLMPSTRPILALGADLKSAITLVFDGQACVSQHIGDLEHYQAVIAFRETIEDLLAMYHVETADLLVAHDAHPQYASTAVAEELGAERIAVQHHHAHIASVLAEYGAWDRDIVGVALDGTGFGWDGAIWGGEIFRGSLRKGFERIGHLVEARMPGGDAAARHPEQAAAGFVEQIDHLPDLSAPPFGFSERYAAARKLLEKDLRVFRTTSTGRLFDAAAALTGFTRPVTFEAQAAMWLEQRALEGSSAGVYPFPELDFRPLLRAVIDDRLRGTAPHEIARRFHLGFARGLGESIRSCADGIDTVVLSGGVFQNQLLLRELTAALNGLDVWVNRRLPCNDGGISFGQAAIAALSKG